VEEGSLEDDPSWELPLKTASSPRSSGIAASRGDGNRLGKMHRNRNRYGARGIYKDTVPLE
jgi:hypothetical protein